MRDVTARLLVLFAVIAAAAVAMSVVAVHQVTVTAENHDAIDHGYNVRGAIRRMMAAVATAEAAARTGPVDRGAVGDRFAAAEENAHREVAGLVRRVEDNPRQLKAAVGMDHMLDDYFGALRAAAAGGPATGDFDAAMGLQERIAAIAEDGLAEEARLLEIRSSAATFSVTQSLVLFIGGTALALTVLGATFVVVARELRRRQASEAELRQQTRLLSATFESMAQGVLVIDAEMRVLAVNPWAREVFSIPDDLVPGETTFADVLRVQVRAGQMTEAELADRVAGVKAAIDGRSSAKSEYVLADGRVIEIDRRPYSAGGLVSTYTDVTERRRIERLKNEFISTVSHELRTPLTSIRGSLGLVIGGVVGEVAPKAREMIAIAHANSERLVRLINDILDIEKIESGRMQLEMRPHRLHDLVAQAIEANAGYFGQYDVQPELVDRAPEAVVSVDADRFIQVLNNLLSNAAKNSPKGGVVTVGLERAEGRVRISVADRGAGIPEAFRSRIFGKFEQADSSDARQKGGTGLGLSIVKAIVEHLDGRIWFESEVGAGTTFHVDLPELPVEEMAAAETPPRLDGRPQILVVEDDRDVAHLLTLMLEGNGWAVTVAHSAAEAEAAMVGTNFEAMTLDMMLPDEDGLSFFRRLRARAETNALPVVVVSAKAALARKELNGDAIGIVDWLEKPIDQARLGEAVRRAIDGSAGPAHILHVEDDPDIVRVVGAVLGEAVEVTAAGTLAAARRRLAERRYALVIVDVGLPDGSGLDLLDEIRRLDPPPPVVIFSASDFDGAATSDVAASLVKSRTDNAALHDTLQTLIGDLTR